MLFSAVRFTSRHLERQSRSTRPSIRSSLSGLERLEERALLTLAVTPYDVTTPISTLTSALVVPSTGLTISNSTFVGVTGQGGSYQGFDLSDGQNSVSAPDGIVLTSGKAIGVQGPNQNRLPGVIYGTGTQSNNLGQPGDADLSALIQDTTFDANSLTLHFTTAPDIHSLQFQLLFASEEFPQFVGQFNDTFAAFLDGNQITFDSNGNPLTVNNNFFQFNNSGQTAATFPAAQGKTPVNFNFGFDGLTGALTTAAPLNPSVTIHTLKFDIADARDANLDSAIFLSQLRGSTQVLKGPITTPTPTGSFVVTTTADSGAGSLRSAINAVNAAPTPETITFKIPGSGPQTISLDSPLPTITNSVIIDGYSQAGSTANTAQVGDNANLMVELDGTGAGKAADGLHISAPNSIIAGLAINRFDGNGITLDSSAKGTSIVGDFIGTDVQGTKGLGNGGFGVAAEGAGGITIGGISTTSRNLISGNLMAGIELKSGSTGDLLLGNYVGTSASGMASIGNKFDGVLVSDSPRNTIGGTGPGASNLISGNGSSSSQGAGLRLEGEASTGNLVLGNSIGTTADGLGKLGNSVIGLLINDASGNTIGGTSPAARNVISGNVFAGLMIAGSSTANQVLGNAIGTDFAGLHAIGNGGLFQGSVVGNGVFIDGSSGNVIGGAAPGSANVISGNLLDGLQIFAPNATGNLVQNNKIGTDITGNGPLGNGGDGVVLNGSPSNVIVGNVIAANLGNGITFSGNTTTGNLVADNAIGLNASLNPLPNGGFGLAIVNQASTTGLGSNAVGNNTLGPVRNTNLAPASTPPVSTKPAVIKSTKAGKVQTHKGSFSSRPMRPLQKQGHATKAHSKG